MKKIMWACFRFCNWCGAEYSAVKVDEQAIACEQCFMLNHPGHSQNKSANDYWEEYWKSNRKKFMEALYKETKDEKIRTKIMAEILGSKDR